MTNLHNLLANMPFESLPPEWTTLDLAAFSRGKSLWEYQQAALQNALKALWMYYGNDGAADDHEAVSQRGVASSAVRNDMRKQTFLQWYLDNRIEPEPELNLGRKRENAELLAPYYPVTEGKIPYAHFINRMGFWMATGSGKTLVIVKMLEALYTLMKRGALPVQDVMVLTHREDLLKQLIDHTREFNTGGRAPYIRLRELREYPEVKRGAGRLFGGEELNVFYYRSDNLSDGQKERILDFRNYDNNGNWYVLLDEAHKGDKEDSKRQHIYSILSRNGFLFNFSATFTDARDIQTTAYEFNLSSFIQSGYGKHISLLKQENRAFRDKEDYTNEEKQRIVLQSLMMLAYVAKARAGLCEAAGREMYHRPLLLALVNSVNTEEADLKLFFRELERIGRGEISSQMFTAAKAALKAELDAEPEWLYEGANFKRADGLFESLTMKDIYRQVFNAESRGDIEVLVRPSNDKELAFKLKTSAAPFALIKIGQTTEWLKDFLAGYEIVQGFEDESFFARLNEQDSSINLLMGSRSFYEGWDSNRPNVITFINIGTGAEARKFILQSVGRGVRIEPLKGKRQRLESLWNAERMTYEDLYQKAKPYLPAVQSLFIFGTKREALAAIFSGLEQEREKEEGIELALDVNEAALSHHPVLVPVYRRRDGQLLVELQEPRKFELQEQELEMLRRYRDYLGDERLLLARHELTPQQIGLLEKTLARPAAYFNPNASRKFGSVDLLLPRLAQYFNIIPQEVQGFKPLEQEISHYKHIRVLLKDIEELREKIARVRGYQDPAGEKAKLREQRRTGEIDDDAYDAAIERLAQVKAEETFDHDGQRLHIKNIASHYYLPLLVSNDDRLDYMSRIIKVKSERKFIIELESYFKQPDNLFHHYDWWMFSRADETLDRIQIPYYDSSQNKMREFHPDFIFWLVKGRQYTILFVDPKGYQNTGYQYKVDGYKELFLNADESPRTFPYHGYSVRVALSLYTDDSKQPPQGYRKYWYDSPAQILQNLLD